MSKLTLADMNMLLYCCDAEERENGGGCYNVPSWVPLKYGGLQGTLVNTLNSCIIITIIIYSRNVRSTNTHEEFLVLRTNVSVGRNSS